MNKFKTILVREELREPYSKVIDKEIESSGQVTEILKALGLNDSPCEAFWVLLFNTKNHCIGAEEISKGSITACGVNAAAIFRTAMLGNAFRIIIAHNHPSGDTNPSAEDVKATKIVRDAGKLLGIQLIDHVIVGPDNAEYYSFREHELVVIEG